MQSTINCSSSKFFSTLILAHKKYRLWLRLLSLTVRTREGFVNREHAKFETFPLNLVSFLEGAFRSIDMNEISDVIFNFSRTFL